MIKEFKDFIMRGSVLELAVAVIIAGAFGNVITSFTNDILMPPIGMALGNVDFSDLKYVLQAAVADADGNITAPEVAVRWGQWLKFIIDFIIIAFIIFMLVRFVNKVKAGMEEEKEAAPEAPAADIVLLTEIRDALKK